MSNLRIFFLFAIFLSGCSGHEQFSILVGYEEPQNTIARAIVEVGNKSPAGWTFETVRVDSLNATDALLNGSADIAIIDNYLQHDERIKTVVPLFDQILHLLVRNEIVVTGNTVSALLTNRKVYAGAPDSSTRKFVDHLIADYDLTRASIQFVDVVNLFQADVIFSFTDLLTQDELKDLTEYRFYSFDKVDDLTKGSLTEGVCARHPEFQPYVINRELYGNFTPGPIVTVAFKSLLAARDEVPDQVVYELLEQLEAHKPMITTINPLLYNFTTDFESGFLTFQIHPGAIEYLNRFEPVFIQKYADLFGVVISIIVAAGSLSYSFRQWKNARKKNKIDIYYGKLMSIRSEILAIEQTADVHRYMAELKAIQQETMQLVMREKLNADESFLIFLSVSKIIHDDLKEKLQTLPSRTN